jgi:CheY-like chemotaxis protein
MASNGQEAVDAYKNSKLAVTDAGARMAINFDVIIMDHTMPVMVSNF